MRETGWMRLERNGQRAQSKHSLEDQSFVRSWILWDPTAAQALSSQGSMQITCGILHTTRGIAG